jgi:hypothetical protein
LRQQDKGHKLLLFFSLLRRANFDEGPSDDLKANGA